jgi:hypothetical protein
MKPIARTYFLDEPAIAGAQWWQQSVSAATSRRNVLRVVVGSTIAISACGIAPALPEIVNDIFGDKRDWSAGDEQERTENALVMQRRFGWSVGAQAKPLPLERAVDISLAGQTAQQAALNNLALRPPEAWLLRYYSAALVDVPTATPVETPPAEVGEAEPFKTAFKPLAADAFAAVFCRGQALARLFAQSGGKFAAIIDLPGPDSIAFAAGMASLCSPVLVMNNWPHPLGVVPTHDCVAALAIFAAYFREAAAARQVSVAAAWVLDRNRLRPLLTPESSFDNRYQVTLPTASALLAQQITDVFYICSAETDAPSMDIAPELAQLQAQGVHVHLVPLQALASTQGMPIAVNTQSSMIRSLANVLYRFGPPKPLDAAALDRGLMADADERSTFHATYLKGPGTPIATLAAWQPRTPVAASDITNSAGGNTTPTQLTALLGTVAVVTVGGVIVGTKLAKIRGSWGRSPGRGSGSWGFSGG